MAKQMLNQGSQDTKTINQGFAMANMLMKAACTAMLLGLLSACGGGGGGEDVAGGSLPTVTPAGTSGPAPKPTATEASRFLIQSSFGPTEAGIETLRTSSYANWINDQFALPVGSTALDFMDKRRVEIKAANATQDVSANQFYEYFWRSAVTSPDQLRQRVTFSLSQIFVISFAGADINPRGAASYYDMLSANSFGNFRKLLEDVTLHPMMGVYLTHIANRKEDPATGRTPDENYAREILQLFSIGLFELNTDGTVKKDSDGNPIPSYTSADISNLAKVFTGFSWFNATPSNGTFGGGGRTDASFVTPMIAYPAFHSLSEKRFLGTVIPASTTSDATGDLKIALDTIFNHPNVGPFIGRQLIQRLVTSNPSPAYVGRVASAFNNNGSGVRGDMRAVIRAVLLDTEARTAVPANDATYGKLREPVLRMTALLRAGSASSKSGNWTLNSTSAATSLSQTPLASPSVFNFYRPGYSPPNTKTGNLGLVAPEMQIVNEVTVAGYLNTMQMTINSGIGSGSGGSDVTLPYAKEIALANNPAALVDHLNNILTAGSLTTARRQQIIDAVTAVAIPATPTTTLAQIDAALLNRSKLAMFLTVASPDFIIQR
jgi:uncharacterized protein (DUF1800 family)